MIKKLNYILIITAIGIFVWACSATAYFVSGSENEIKTDLRQDADVQVDSINVLNKGENKRRRKNN